MNGNITPPSIEHLNNSQYTEKALERALETSLIIALSMYKNKIIYKRNIYCIRVRIRQCESADLEQMWNKINKTKRKKRSRPTKKNQFSSFFFCTLSTFIFDIYFFYLRNQNAK